MTRYAMINGEKVAAPADAIAWKYGDPTEDARWVYDEGDRDEIAANDPGLLAGVEDSDV